MLRLLLIIFVPIALIVVVILYIQNQKMKSSQGANPGGSAAGQMRSKNPLIDAQEIQRVQNGSKQASGSAKPTAKPVYHFDYKLAPNIKEKQSYVPHISVVDAASGCSIDGAPATVTAYALTAHVSPTGVKKIAGDYGLSGDAASIPMEDGTSFKYYLSDPAASAFLEIIEPSGMYRYHKALKDDPTKADVTLATAKTNAATLLKAHMLDASLNPTDAQFDAAAKQFALSYRKDYSGLKLIDAAQVKLLAESNSICDIMPTDLAGTIIVTENSKGDVTNVQNNIRQAVETHTFAREKIDDALAEYATTPIMPPVVFGSKTSGTVTITETQLTYFDYGNTYGQKMYVPVYLTSGTVSGGTKVITLFPAVSGSELDKAPAFMAKSGTKSLQIDTFNTAPAMSPGAPVGGCFGGLVDYQIQCSVDSTPLCSGAYSLPSTSDPLGACTKGCQTVKADIDLSKSVDACADFAKQQGADPGSIRTGAPGGYNPIRQSGQQPSTGKATCSFSACPC